MPTSLPRYPTPDRDTSTEHAAERGDEAGRAGVVRRLFGRDGHDLDQLDDAREVAARLDQLTDRLEGALKRLEEQRPRRGPT